jgi:uncharacterized protein
VKPFALLVKPAGADCNLACPHCFYSSRKSTPDAGSRRMSRELLERLVEDYLKLRSAASTFMWQGGEPTLMGLDFYREAVELQKKYGQSGQVVSNSLQTNGVLLDDEWCRFLREYKWLVGISIDGPKELHDHYRKDCGGSGSFEKAMAGVEACRKNRVEFNILTLITENNCSAADDLFNFHVREKFGFVQLIPCSEKGYSAKPEQFGKFLCRYFDRWVASGPQRMSVRLFDSLMMYALSGEHSDCTFGSCCDGYVVVEHDGDVYPCDFFVEEDWRLGNITESPIEQLAGSEKRQEFSAKKRARGNKCLVCRWCGVCQGGCMKDRLVMGGWSEPSHWCQGYRQVFEYAMPRLTQIAAGMQR